MFGTSVLGFSGSRMFWKIVLRHFGSLKDSWRSLSLEMAVVVLCVTSHCSSGLWRECSCRGSGLCPLKSLCIAVPCRHWYPSFLTYSTVLFWSKPKALAFRPQRFKSHEEARLCSITRPIPRLRPKVMGDFRSLCPDVEIFPVSIPGLPF